MSEAQSPGGDFLVPEPFDLGKYLDARANAESFMLVELGHGIFPIAANQPNLHKKQTAYVGYETWQHGGVRQFGEKRAQEIIDNNQGRNIFFVNGYPFDGPVNEVQRLYYHDYDPVTNIRDDGAHEVFLGNTFGVEFVGKSPEHTHALLKEVLRIVDPRGKVIIRETYSPEFARSLTQLVESGALQVDAMITQDDAEAWDRLEELYGNASPEPTKPNAFYLVLPKQDVPLVG